MKCVLEEIFKLMFSLRIHSMPAFAAGKSVFSGFLSQWSFIMFKFTRVDTNTTAVLRSFSVFRFLNQQPNIKFLVNSESKGTWMNENYLIIVHVNLPFVFQHKITIHNITTWKNFILSSFFFWWMEKKIIFGGETKYYLKNEWQLMSERKK